ncbi:hypothetical protein SAMN02745121_00063 [Nannocystis exedens]|uniref:Uncharacterized protein n=1 Tax=Nannocystis exedens TaxID=54 RepID=A0A1I1SNP1_9BACT|nr:hypothetical protein [Nannocystis exedens]PCC75523.1 lipoprotein [Nannocystis exedens]SFD46338.1 hypothetical protein SAMN02745121_00063 [Nannocystis exedens]
MSRRPLVLLPLVLAACVARPSGDTDDQPTGEPATAATESDSGPDPSGSTSAPPTTAPPTTGPAPTTTEPTSGTATTDAPEPTTDAITTTPFIPGPDVGSLVECDPWVEDCPQGQKCMPWASDGGNHWNALKCVDIAPNPDGLGEPCSVIGSPVSGEDTCDKHMQCFNVDPDTLQGTCLAMCTGTPDKPGCEQPDAICSLSGDGVLALCLPQCDPLAPDCRPGDTCIPHPKGSGFVCVIDAGGDEGQLFDACEFTNFCDPGLLCIGPKLASECDPAETGCCLPFCDLTAPPSCPGQGQECLSWFEQGQAPPGHEDLGVCGLPQP